MFPYVVMCGVRETRSRGTPFISVCAQCVRNVVMCGVRVSVLSVCVRVVRVVRVRFV